MAKINLLPWREERRQELKKQFLTVLAGVAVLGIALVLLAHQIFSGIVDGQRERNAYLQKHIDELNQQVREISEIDKKRRELLDRMKIIQQLQGNRPIIVRIFDELVRTVPDGVFFQNLNRTADKIDLRGVAESNNRVSSLMRNLDGSGWFASPNLTSVKANPSYGEQASEFQLSFVITTPEADESEE